MAKTTEKPSVVEHPEQLHQALATPANGEPKPKKKRTPGIKYKTRITTVPVGPTDNPLDQPAIPIRGGFKFPGLIFENTLAGCIVKIPAKAAYMVNPTIRELFTVLSETFDPKKTEETK